MVGENTPKVSIGLPVYNGERFLEEALESLLAQTYTDFEVIISDNASTDSTQDICENYSATDQRVKYHRSDVNHGAAWNFNQTFYLSHGEYFKWAAHDDLVEPEFLHKCVEFMDLNKAVVLCFTRTVFIDEDRNELKEYEYPIKLNHVSRKRLFMHFVCASHIDTEIFGLIRSNILRKTRLIDGFVGSDFVLLGELVLHGAIHQLPEVLFSHREHAGRSTKATKDPEEYTEWFDSSKRVMLTMPYWRRIYEISASVARHPMSLAEKRDYLIEICRAAKWSRHTLVTEVKRAAGRLTKSYGQ